MLTLLPASRFPFFVYYAVLGNEIERVQAGLNFLPLAGAGLVDPDVGADLVAGLGVGFAEAGVADGAGMMDDAMQHHIDRVTLIIESEDEGDLPHQGAVAVVPVNLGLLPMNELPQ